MKLIVVEADFAAADLDAAVDLFVSHAEGVKGMAGCRHYALYCKPSGDGLAILQQWTTMEEFDAYRASDLFAKLGAGLRPMMTAPPVTVVAEVDTV